MRCARGMTPTLEAVRPFGAGRSHLLDARARQLSRTGSDPRCGPGSDPVWARRSAGFAGSWLDSCGLMGLLGYFNGFGGRDMAVDLGTANTLVYVRGRGSVLSEPAVVAFDQPTGEDHLVGGEAKIIHGRT